MNCSVNILSCNIQYEISTHGVHIICDDGFYKMMHTLARTGTALLAIALIRDFKKHQNRPLPISKKSLIIEIWGHYYFEKIFEQFKWMLRNPLTIRLKQRLVKATDAIDCAGYGYDNNRWVWDSLVPFYPIIKARIKDSDPASFN